MGKEQILQQIGIGAAAGLVGTAALQAVRSVGQRVAPQASPPMSEEPGEYMVKQAQSALPKSVRSEVGQGLKTAASTLLSFGYGSAGTALYSAMRERPSMLLDGAALGAGIWAIGYLGWLPALRLTPPVTEQKPGQVAMSVVQHIAFGIAAIAAYRKLRKSLTPQE